VLKIVPNGEKCDQKNWGRGGGIIGKNILLFYFMFKSMWVILKQEKISQGKTDHNPAK
jgi:hypothetical protein